jgi:hypothetical protein
MDDHSKRRRKKGTILLAPLAIHSIGVKNNIYQVADPAFLMDPVKPKEIENIIQIEDEAIGINLSPLMSKYATGGDLDRWTKISASIIEMVAKKTEIPIYLIPHVTNNSSNDYTFMKRALSLIQSKSEKIVGQR